MIIETPQQLFDRAREVARLKHYAYKTEQAYVHWIRRFVAFQSGVTRCKWENQRLKASSPIALSREKRVNFDLRERGRFMIIEISPSNHNRTCFFLCQIGFCHRQIALSR